MGKDVKTPRKMISTIKLGGKHPFAGRNPQWQPQV